MRFLPFSPKAVFFLPQKPFVSDGTLRQQVTTVCHLPVVMPFTHSNIAKMLSLAAQHFFASIDTVYIEITTGSQVSKLRLPVVWPLLRIS